jgi:ubiquitin-conjugating enzyme E2 J1
MNARNPAIRRLGKEWQEIQNEQLNEHFRAYPLDGDLFEWHFTIAGPVDTPYEGGLYHGRLLLPPEYPFKPPSIIFTTPNGRFQTGVKICLSITGYHPEFWQPAWGIRTGLMAIISMMPQKDPSSLGSLSCSDTDIRIFASKSPQYICPYCLSSNEDIWKGAGPLPSTLEPNNHMNTPNASSEPNYTLLFRKFVSLVLMTLFIILFIWYIIYSQSIFTF